MHIAQYNEHFLQVGLLDRALISLGSPPSTSVSLDFMVLTKYFFKLYRLTKTHVSLISIFPGEPGLASFPLYSFYPYFLFNSNPSCSSQTGEGMAVKEEEWKKSTFHDVEILILRLDSFPVANQY